MKRRKTALRRWKETLVGLRGLLVEVHVLLGWLALIVLAVVELWRIVSHIAR